MTTLQYFKTSTGIKTGNIILDAASGNANVANLNATGNISTNNFSVANNVNSNLNPGSNGIFSLGSTLQQYANLFISGQISVNNQTITANATSIAVSGDLVATSANITALTTSSILSNTANINTITVNNQLSINNTINATTTKTGTLVTEGGIGVQKDLYVGGAVNLANNNGGNVSKVAIAYNDNTNAVEFQFK